MKFIYFNEQLQKYCRMRKKVRNEKLNIQYKHEIFFGD